MKRALVILCLAAAGHAVAANPASAQGVFVRLGAEGDTAFATSEGGVIGVPVLGTDANNCSPGYCYYYFTRARLTFWFDPTKIAVLGVQPPSSSGLYTVNDTTRGPGYFTVDASGSVVAYRGEFYRLHVRLLPGAAPGAYVWIQPDSVLEASCYGCTPSFVQARSRIAQVCSATQIYGDVDANAQVDSRDALITLSAAVGLPVSGFDLAMGDVDADGLTNSRDALMMLSYAIALPAENAADRTGFGIPSGCPGPTPPGEPVVFVRTGSAAGLYRLEAATTTPVQISTYASDNFPRLDSSGQRLVFQCDSVLTPQVCVANGVDGSSRTQLGPGSPQSGFPDWSPDGTRIAFPQSGFLSLMDSSGANRAYFVGGATPTYGANGVGWGRDGARLAFGGPTGTVRTVTLDTAHTVIVLDASIIDGDQMRWSPDGATVLFTRSNWSIWAVSASGGDTAGRVTPFFGGSRAFDVGSTGLVFSAEGPGGDQALWRLPNGPEGPIFRLTAPPVAQSAGDYNPTTRRLP